MKDIIDCDRIKPLLSDLYKNDTEKGGRPNFDPVFMIKIMFLQSLYGLVDEAMEIELYSNIRFMNFLDYPESVPDARNESVWFDEGGPGNARAIFYSFKQCVKNPRSPATPSELCRFAGTKKPF